MHETAEWLNNSLAGRYSVERSLGAGGMATVWLATDLRHARKVAIKVLRPELAAALGTDRFLHEIHTVATLQHPHILGLIDSGEMEGTAFYVMPFVEGESLRDRLEREQQLSIKDALRIAAELAAALDYAHRRGVIHRDIKPENVLLHEGTALLADFGIALAQTHGNSRRMTQTGVSLGTPHYMSPEQATGEREISTASDIFALGCVVHEMLAGEPPFTGPNAQAVIAKVLTGEPAPLVSLRRSVPAHVSAAVLVALEKLPADRFPSAAQFAAALAGEAPGGAQRVTRDATRELRRWKLIAACLGVAAASGIAGWVTSGNQADNTRPPVAAALLMSEAAPLDPRRLDITLSPDGAHLVFASTADTSLYVRALDNLEPVRIPRTARARQPRFSPDGRWLAYRSGSQLMKVRFPLDGQPPTALLDSVADFSWGENDVIAFTRPRGGAGPTGLWVSDADGAAAREIAPVDTSDGVTAYTQPHVLPGGRGVVFVVRRGLTSDTELAVLALRDSTVRRLGITGANPRYLEGGQLLFTRSDGSAAVVALDLRALRTGGPVRAVLDSVLVDNSALAQLSVSHAGTLAYISGTTFEELVRVNRNGVVTGVYGRQPGRFATPRFSPECDRVAVLTVLPGTPMRTNVVVYAPDLQRVIPLTTDGRAGSPAWTDGGRSVVFGISSRMTGQRDSSTLHPGQYQRPWNAASASRLIRDSSYGAAVISTSRVGSLLYATRSDVDRRPSQFYLTRADSGAPVHPVSAVAGRKEGPALSPDGKWVAYSALSDAGRLEIWVSSLVTAGSHHRITSNGGTAGVGP